MIAIGRTLPRWSDRAQASAPAVAAAAVGVAAMLAAVAFGFARAVSGPAPVPNPIADFDGISVGIERSPAGALAAADEYVTVSYDTVERDPTRDRELIDTVYAPSVRADAILGAAAVRAANQTAMALWAHGGQNISLVGARRLDYYDSDIAQVTTWSADVFWGAGRAPKQNWVLTHTSLEWSHRRWLVTAITTLPSAGPVPALTPQSTPANDSARTFGALSGFVTPSYGTPG